MRGTRWRRVGAPLLAGLLLLGLLSVSLAQAPPAKIEPAQAKTDVVVAPVSELDAKLMATAKDKSEILSNLTYLSDVIGPRLTGSPQLKRANEWTAERMKSYGLSNVHLEKWTIPEGWERGTATARMIEPDTGRTLSLASLGWQPGTPGKITGDVVYINARTMKELEPYKGKLKNAIVLRSPPSQIRPLSELLSGVFENRPLTPARPQDPPIPPEPTGTSELQPPDRFTFQRELQEFLRTEGVALMLSDAGKPHNLLTTTGGWGRGGDRASAQNRVPTAMMVHEHYAMLHRLATRQPAVKTQIEVEISNKFIPGPIVVHNTVGEIKGSEKPDEVVILGAHLDSWDLGQGTTDNGTGSCVVMEAARIIAKSGVQPKRTIRFCLFTGEEQGLYGSKEYVNAHKDEMAKVTAALVHDTGTGKVVGLGWSANRTYVKPLLEKELTALKGLGVQELFGRTINGSDHQSFESAGVPSVIMRQDSLEYRLTHHSQSDTLDKAREPDLIQGAQVMAITAMHFANLEQMLPRAK